jgi:hypothetical protein
VVYQSVEPDLSLLIVDLGWGGARGRGVGSGTATSRKVAGLIPDEVVGFFN